MSSIPQGPRITSQHASLASHAISQFSGQYQKVSLEEKADHALPDVSTPATGNVLEEIQAPATATTDPSHVSTNKSTTQNVGALEQKVESELPSQNTRFERLSHKYDRVTSDHWTYELVGVFVSVATLVSTIGILLAYQGGPTPHIMRGVSVSCPPGVSVGSPS